jgi:dethiobiotin synthetase
LRPKRLVLVTGTGTDVGKTWVTAALLTELRARGWRVAVRKPVQSAQPGVGWTDAEVLAEASGESADEVCPPERSYEVPMTPFMAADVLGRRLGSLAEMVGGLVWPTGVVVGLVESVGGVRSPITEAGEDSVTMATLLLPDLTVLVADAGLGTLNGVRLSVDALEGDVVVVLNRFDAADDLHRRNLAWLSAHLGRPTVTSIRALADLVAGVP